MTEVEYLGYHISAKGITVLLDNGKAVGEWLVPGNVKEVQEFLGFANCYRHFIEVFSQMCRPLIDNLRNGMKFEWTSACQELVRLLNGGYFRGPILAHFNLTPQLK